MADYIKQEDVYQYLDNEVEWKVNQDRLYALEVINDFPTADVAEVRHGRWKNGICTDCGFDIRCLTDGENDLEEWVWEGLDYCPNCGARMGKEDEHD